MPLTVTEVSSTCHESLVRIEIRAAAFIQIRAVGLHPSIARRVINFDATFHHHHFFQIPVAQVIAKILANIQPDLILLNVTPFEMAGRIT